METTYQGYRNRSTWLAVLHLNNTTAEITKEAEAIADKWEAAKKEMKDFDKICPHSYSYPHFQQMEMMKKFKKLLQHTKIQEEQEYNYREIDFDEVSQSLASE